MFTFDNMVNILTKVNNKRGSKMLTINEIRKRLEDRNLAAVARKVGVTRVWIHAIYTGKVDSCSPDLQARLSQYFKGE